MNVRSHVDLKLALSRRAYQTSTLLCRSSSTGSSLQPQPTVAWPPAQTPGRLEGRPLGWVSKEGTWADEGNAWTKTAEGSLSIWRDFLVYNVFFSNWLDPASREFWPNPFNLAWFPWLKCIFWFAWPTDPATIPTNSNTPTKGEGEQAMVRTEQCFCLVMCTYF